MALRYLIVSDIHGNLEALRAVLAHARRKRRDRILFLGDAVGYGASPNQVVEMLRSFGRTLIAVRGNHDRAALDPERETVLFNNHARHAALWTARTLTAANRRFLAGLHPGPVEVDGGVLLCHGSPVDEDEYLFSEIEAESAFQAATTPIALFGHSHIPCFFELNPGAAGQQVVGSLLRGSRVVADLDRERRYLINPGSVGQPRDRDVRAAYGMYDTEARRFTLYRVAYDVAASQRRIMAAGLPPVLGERLGKGA